MEFIIRPQIEEDGRRSWRVHVDADQELRVIGDGRIDVDLVGRTAVIRGRQVAHVVIDAPSVFKAEIAAVVERSMNIPHRHYVRYRLSDATQLDAFVNGLRAGLDAMRLAHAPSELTKGADHVQICSWCTDRRTWHYFRTMMIVADSVAAALGVEVFSEDPIRP